MNRIRLTSLAVVLSIAGFAATAHGTARTAAGGLSISPTFLEHEARAGRVGEIRIANGSSRTVAVRVGARPWIQARSGAVRPNDRRSLQQVRLGATSFSLAPGGARSVPVALLSQPRSGSLYGTIDVLGTPRGERPRNGIRARYRLLAGLRLNPSRAARRLRVRVGAARAGGRHLALPVRNTGNTVEPVGGSATISGPSGTRRASFAARRILPGAVVDLSAATGSLPRGRYSARVTLVQGGRRVAAVARSFRVR